MCCLSNDTNTKESLSDFDTLWKIKCMMNLHMLLKLKWRSQTLQRPLVVQQLSNCTIVFCNFRLTTLIDVKKTLEYLAYLGYMYEHDSQLSAIHGMCCVHIT